MIILINQRHRHGSYKLLLGLLDVILELLLVLHLLDIGPLDSVTLVLQLIGWLLAVEEVLVYLDLVGEAREFVVEVRMLRLPLFLLDHILDLAWKSVKGLVLDEVFWVILVVAITCEV